MTVCSVEGCSKSVKARGWCAMHYSRWVKYGEVGPAEAYGHIVQHGTVNEYMNFGCRCDECRAAVSDYQRQASSAPCPTCGRSHYGRYRPGSLCRDCYVAKTRENLVHGTESGYKRGCRCAECKEAGNRARRERRYRNPDQRERENRKRLERYYASRTTLQKASSGGQR